jgi:hypothetical protein
VPSKTESKPEKCPQCENMTFSILPGASRKTCSLCAYVSSEDLVKPLPFQMVSQAHVSSEKRKYAKKTVNLSPILLGIILLSVLYFGFQYLYQEPEELDGLGALERSYNKTNRYLLQTELNTNKGRSHVRQILKQEHKTILRLKVSTCLQGPRLSLAKLYDIYDKDLEKANYQLGKKSRRIVNTSMKFVSAIENCKETYVPNQNAILSLFKPPQF